MSKTDLHKINLHKLFGDDDGDDSETPLNNSEEKNEQFYDLCGDIFTYLRTGENGDILKEKTKNYFDDENNTH